MKCIIRPERPKDYYQTEHMVMRAFWNIHGPGCNEHLLVRILRDSDDYLPELSRVAELDGKIVGAIFYTKAKIINDREVHNIIAFGPLAVEPTLQNAGIGAMLLEETFALARKAGYPGICIYGEPEYYPKRGFKTCDHFGITDPEGRNFDALMAYPLDEAAFNRIHGRLYESPVFDRCDDPALLESIRKEFPDYPRIKIQEGFLQIQERHFGTVKSVNGADYVVRFWELELPARLSPAGFGSDRLPKAGDWVLFRFHDNGMAEITSICENLL